MIVVIDRNAAEFQSGKAHWPRFDEAGIDMPQMMFSDFRLRSEMIQ